MSEQVRVISMDLSTRQHYPFIQLGGMSIFPASEYSDVKEGFYTLTRTGEKFKLLDELKKCCLFGASGVFAAFSNAIVYFDVNLVLGRISTVNFDNFLPEGFSGRDLIVIAHPIYSGVGGDISKGEFMFPHFQFTGPKQINITASAFDNCPFDFQPSVRFSFYLSFYSNDRAVQLLQKSILEFSQNRPNFAAIYLYAAVESASTILSGREDGKVSARIHEFAKTIEKLFPDVAKRLKRIKKNIERRIVVKRGDFAHQGADLTQQDLLPSYETALEFFWYYNDMKSINS